MLCVHVFVWHCCSFTVCVCVWRGGIHVCMLAVYVKCVCVLFSYVCAHACLCVILLPSSNHWERAVQVRVVVLCVFNSRSCFEGAVFNSSSLVGHRKGSWSPIHYIHPLPEFMVTPKLCFQCKHLFACSSYNPLPRAAGKYNMRPEANLLVPAVFR